MRRQDIEALEKSLREDLSNSGDAEWVDSREERHAKHIDEEPVWVPEIGIHMCKSCVFEAWVHKWTLGRDLSTGLHKMIESYLHVHKLNHRLKDFSTENFAWFITRHILKKYF